MNLYEPVRCDHGIIVAYCVNAATFDGPLPLIDDWCPICQLGVAPEDDT